MYDTLHRKIEEVCHAFRIEGRLQEVQEVCQGIINRTFKVTVLRPDGTLKSYMVQKINTLVFTDPVQVMENIDHVTEYLHAKLPGRTALHFHHTADRKNYVDDRDGFWRLFNFIPSRTYDACRDLTIIRNAGRAFGEFQQLLGDFDASLLHETIPHFHDTQRRYEHLEAVVKADPCGLVSQVEPELDWLFSVRARACTLSDLRRSGELPLRVTHNDTKINNVLFQQESKEAIVVIDLDTVMPGLVGHDFGDAVRFAANRVPEDCPDFQRAAVDLDIFQAFALGFLGETAPSLTQREADTLALSAFVMTTEQAVRFLDDYLSGSTYFRISHPTHNLERARCQIALAQDMERHLGEMERIVRSCMELCR